MNTLTGESVPVTEENPDMPPQPVRASQNDALAALSMLDRVVSSSDVDENDIKSMAEIHNFIEKVYMNPKDKTKIGYFFKKVAHRHGGGINVTA
ncbi:hypothetical protein PR048_003299 [Dryococelus australis]|uniref:Uncharacterized protein n=1 Tax=Dryococelus australis TaxID=614101 RepID=A0ABQ9IMQ7_9NEOP|nr:hypothetical protein PR048_003299 [Dryococelus australis]